MPTQVSTYTEQRRDSSSRWLLGTYTQVGVGGKKGGNTVGANTNRISRDIFHRDVLSSGLLHLHRWSGGIDTTARQTMAIPMVVVMVVVTSWCVLVLLLSLSST